MVELVEFGRGKREKKRERRKRRHEAKKKSSKMAKNNAAKITFSDSSSEASSDENPREDNEDIPMVSELNETEKSLEKIGTSSAHGAAIDAFMAVFTVVALMSRESLPSVVPTASPTSLPQRFSKLEKYRNRLNGPNPNVGIFISKSAFVKFGPERTEFLEFIEYIVSA